MFKKGEHYIIKLSEDLSLLDFFVNKVENFNFEGEKIIKKEYNDSFVKAIYINYEPLDIEEDDEPIYIVKNEVNFTIDTDKNYLYYLAEERNSFFEDFLKRFFVEIEYVHFDNNYFKRFLLLNKMLAPIQVHIQVLNGTFIKDVAEIDFESPYNPLSHYKKNKIDADIKKIVFLYDPEYQIRFTIHRKGKVDIDSNLKEGYSIKILRFIVDSYNKYKKGVDCFDE